MFRYLFGYDGYVCVERERWREIVHASGVVIGRAAGSKA